MPIIEFNLDVIPDISKGFGRLIEVFLVDIVQSIIYFVIWQSKILHLILDVLNTDLHHFCLMDYILSAIDEIKCLKIYGFAYGG